MAGKRSTKTEKKTIIVSILLVVLAVGAISSVWYYKNYKNYLADKEFENMLDIDTIYNNIYIENIHVGGLTKEQAIEKVNVELQQKRSDDKKLILVGYRNSYQTEMSFKDAGLKYDIEKVVDEAYNYGRSGTIAEKREIQIDLEMAGKYFTAHYDYDMDMVTDFLEGISGEVEATYREATGSKDATMDIEHTASMINSLLNIREDEGVVNIAFDN